jgi:hypothetical protein
VASQAKRHHYVPEFYLKRFADAKGKIRVYRSHTRLPAYETSTKNAAVKTGLYTIAADDGQTSGALESELAKIEAKAQDAISRSLGGTFPLPSDERSDLALFIALQFVRTPEEKERHGVVVDTIEKSFYEGMTEEWARERLTEIGKKPTDDLVALVMDISRNPESYVFRTHPNDFLRAMVQVAVQGVAPVLSKKAWWLGTSTGPSFITGDHPLVLIDHPAGLSPYRGGGLLRAEEVFFPLDRHHVLTLRNSPGFEGRTLVPRERVNAINAAVAGSSYQCVFQHPGDPPIGSLIPMKPRPLMRVNLEPVFVDNSVKSQKKVLEPLFAPYFARVPSEDDLPTVPRLIPRENLIHFGI